MNWRLTLSISPLALFVIASPAKADPCEGPLPSRPSVEFSGTVRYVGDGDSLCVGQTDDPNEWIEVRIADFDAPELHRPGGEAAKAALVRFGPWSACRLYDGERSKRPGRFLRPSDCSLLDWFRKHRRLAPSGWHRRRWKLAVVGAALAGRRPGSTIRNTPGRRDRVRKLLHTSDTPLRMSEICVIFRT